MESNTPHASGRVKEVFLIATGPENDNELDITIGECAETGVEEERPVDDRGLVEMECLDDEDGKDEVGEKEGGLVGV